MKAIVIDSLNKEIREVDIPGNLASLQEIVGGYVELVRLQEREDLYVNDEGLINGTTTFFSIDRHLLAGNGVVIGSNSDGELVPTKMTVEELSRKVGWHTVLLWEEAKA